MTDSHRLNHSLANALQVLSSRIRLLLSSRTEVECADLHAILCHIDTLSIFTSTKRIDRTKGLSDLGTLLSRTIAHWARAYPAKVFSSTNAEAAIHYTRQSACVIVLNELISNAVKHGGQQINVTCRMEKTLLTLSVHDNGSAAHGYVSRPYSGLAIVEQICRAEFGTIPEFAIGPGGWNVTVQIPANRLASSE